MDEKLNIEEYDKQKGKIIKRIIRLVPTLVLSDKESWKALWKNMESIKYYFIASLLFKQY